MSIPSMSSVYAHLYSSRSYGPISERCLSSSVKGLSTAPKFPTLSTTTNSFFHLVPPSFRSQRVKLAVSALQSPKGFGPKQNKSPPKKFSEEITTKRSNQEEVGSDSKDEVDDVVPEVVTNRMLKRLSFTVGLPLVFAVAFFPLYYYLKVIQKVDVPDWLPFVTSVLTFGSAGLGITYGFLSASWEPSKEGSLLGWKEAQANWPVFWQTVRGDKDKKR